MRTIASRYVLGFSSFLASIMVAPVAAAAESGLFGDDVMIDYFAIGLLFTMGIGLAALVRRSSIAA